MISGGTDGSLINDGSITTTGENGDGMIIFGADSSGSITNTGTVTTTGDGSDALISEGNRTTITNSGTVLSTGSNSPALGGGTATAAFMAGSDGTVNNTATGILETTGVDAQTVLIGTNGALNNQGLIRSSGTGSLAVHLAEGSTLDNSGTIENLGSGTSDSSGKSVVYGISAFGGSTLTNSGTIRTTGELAQTILLFDPTFANPSPITINNLAGGIIEQTGDGDGAFDNATAIVNGTNAIINNAGIIRATGGQSIAFASGGSLPITVAINNSGTILAGSSDAFTAIGLSSGGHTITNAATGIIQNTSATGSAFGIGTPSGAVNTIINQGLIEVASGRALFTGDGIEIVDNSGQIIGSVELGGGNDAFTLRESGTVVGITDGQDGIDTLDFVFDVDRTVDGADFQNFETFSKNGTGILTAQGFWNFGSGTASINQGGFVLPAGAQLTASTVNVGLGATLSGSSQINGNLINTGGTVSPSSTLSISGDYTQTAGTLLLNVASLTDFAQIDAGGNIDLQDGAFNVNFLNNFAPSSTDALPLLVAGGFINIAPPSVWISAAASRPTRLIWWTVTIRRTPVSWPCSVCWNRTSVTSPA